MHALLLLSVLAQPDPLSPGALERHVRFLASDDMRGRDNDTPEGARAAAYVADAFRDAGLRPGGKDGWFHDFESAARGLKGRNVIGLLPGKGAERVVVAAHHDGRGVIKGRVQNGADDNASGVAVVIEIARALASSNVRPERSVLFISFDCEEDGMVGSREFVASGLHPVSTIAAAFVLDLVGGSLFPWEGKRLYALGSESSPALRARVAEGDGDLEVRRMGIRMVEPVPGMARSDYHAFRNRRVPFVFFSTGTPWYYHTHADDPERLDFAKLAAVGRTVRKVVEETADAPGRPAFAPVDTGREDVAALRALLLEVVAHRAELRIDDRRVEAARKLAADLEQGADPAAVRKAATLILTVARSQEPEK